MLCWAEFRWREWAMTTAINLKKSIAMLALAIVLSGELFGQAKHTITREDLATLRTASWVELSADGAHLVYVVGREIWLVSTKAGSVPQKLGTGIIPRFSPDGQRLLCLSDKPGALQWWVMDIQ